MQLIFVCSRKTGLGSDQSLGEMEHQFVGGMDPKLDYLEQVAQANSEKLKQTEVERDAATEAAIKNEKTAKDLQMRNEQLVFFLFGNTYWIIYHCKLRPSVVPRIALSNSSIVVPL